MSRRLTVRAFEARRAVRRGDGLKVPCYVFAISALSVYFAAVTRDSDYFIFTTRLPGYPAEENCFYPVLSNYRISALSVTSGRVPAVYPAEGNVLPPRALFGYRGRCYPAEGTRVHPRVLGIRSYRGAEDFRLSGVSTSS